MNNTSHTVQDYLDSLPAWQGRLLQEFRQLIHDASGDITEEIKWGIPAFMFDSKALFTMGAFKSHVKYNFIMNGAQLDDPNKLFNNGLESAKSRSIDITEGQSISASELQQLINQAVEKAA